MITTLVAGLAAVGLSASLFKAPQSASVVGTPAQIEADVQSRIAFEYLARTYAGVDTAFVGNLSPSLIRASGVVSPSLANGEFPASWRAVVAIDRSVSFCTPVNSRSQTSLLSKGFALSTLVC